MKNNWRQKLHLEPENGWLNDPNGLSFFNGAYHVFFQYSPESAYGSGDKCWGHWQSEDLINWKFTGAVIRPDCPEDKDGVYSGSGIVRDGVLYLFYTGNVKEDGEHDYVTSGRGANVIMVTTNDGVHMSEKHILLRNSDYPDFCSCHVRDPKVWEENGRYKMVLGARTLEDKGCVLFYTSDDLISWRYEKSVFVPDFGYMWECPDVIKAGTHKYLSISPQGLVHGEYSHQNVYSSGYFRFDGEPEDFEEWDYGFDFYASQSFTAPDGRVLFIGWMGIGDIPYANPTTELGWQHCLTMPRELVVSVDGNICQRPAREYLALREETGDRLISGSSITAELPFFFESDAVSESFELRFEGILEMLYADGSFTLRFINEKAGGGRDVRRVRIEKLEKIEVIADMSSLEIYLNCGNKVMSSRFYPDEPEIRLASDSIDGKVYRMRGMEVHSDE